MNINIVRPYLPSISDVFKEFDEIFSNGMVTNNSKYLRLFESKLQEYLRSKITPVAFCNGEMALFHLIQAWKLKMGYTESDSFEVLVPSFTFSGTVNAIILNNLKPVFCDINNHLVIDVDKCELPTDNNIKMIIPVSVYGNIPNLNQIKQFAQKNNLVVLFDNAPAFGAKYDNHFINYYGFDEIYSFHATKIFTTMEGGAAVVNQPDIYEYLVRLRDFGQYEKVRGDVDVPGLNSKMQEVSAIVGLKNLEKIEDILNNRVKHIDQYKKNIEILEDSNFLKSMKVDPIVFCPYLYFPIILIEEATNFVEYMKQHNISVRRYYTAVHDLKFYSNKFKELSLDFTNDIKDRIVSLPIHTEMDNSEIEYLFDTINEYFQKEND